MATRGTWGCSRPIRRKAGWIPAKKGDVRVAYIAYLNGHEYEAAMTQDPNIVDLYWVGWLESRMRT